MKTIIAFIIAVPLSLWFCYSQGITGFWSSFVVGFVITGIIISIIEVIAGKSTS